jgi:predicted aspartyl protease
MMKLGRIVALVVSSGCQPHSIPTARIHPQFATGSQSLAIPIDIEADVLYVQVGVNGSQPTWFFLDTGASYSIVSHSLARSLGARLEQSGKVENGVGDARPDLYRVAGEMSFRMPGVVFSHEDVVTLDLDGVNACIDTAAAHGARPPTPVGSTPNAETRRTIGGILGAQFFHSFVVAIDYRARSINVFDPRNYRYVGSGTSLSLEIEGGSAFIRVPIASSGHEPVTARLLVDTGASSALALYLPFAKSNGLLPPASGLHPFSNCGIGGFEKEQSFAGTLEGVVQLGSVRLPSPATDFLPSPTSQGYDGVLGGAAFRNRTVIFDYSRHQMIIE